MINTILFDLDGTLTDPKDGITRCIQFSLKHFDVPMPDTEDLTWCIGPPLRDSFSQLLKTKEDAILDRALSLYRKRFSEKGMFENYIYPEVPQGLERIKASGFRIFLATSKPRIFAKKILDHFRLSQFFNTVYGAELDGSLVDKEELIAHILKTETIDPKHALMVGDRIYDIAGGQQNGVMTAAVTYGYGSPDEIRSSHPDLVLNRFSELPVFLSCPRRPDSITNSEP